MFDNKSPEAGVHYTVAEKKDERCLMHSLQEVQGQLGHAFEHITTRYMLISFPRMGLLPLQYPCVFFGVSDPGSSHFGVIILLARFPLRCDLKRP